MAVDQRIREEQAGFRERRGFSDQIFLAKPEMPFLIKDEYGGHRSTAYEPRSIFITISLNIFC